MADEWDKFYVKKGGSALVLNHIIDDLNLTGAKYVKQSDLDDKIKSLSSSHWLPSYIERYVADNIEAATGLNKKYCECSFCGSVELVHTHEDKGVSNMLSLCSDECRRYSRIFDKCDKSFFKHIRKQYKASKMTTLLFALQRRAVLIKRFKINSEIN